MERVWQEQHLSGKVQRIQGEKAVGRTSEEIPKHGAGQADHYGGDMSDITNLSLFSGIGGIDTINCIKKAALNNGLLNDP